MANNPSVQCSDGRGNPGSPKRPAPAAPSMKIENTPTSGAESDDHIINMDDDVEMGDANVPLNMDWSAQGAIPKGIQCTSEGQFMQSGKHGEALPGEHDRIEIENSWGELKVTVKLRTGNFTIDAAPYIHPCIMQHMVKSPMLKYRMELTKIKEMNTTKAGHFVIQDMDCRNIVSRETLQKEIIESFQKIVQGNICVVEDKLQVKGGFLEKLQLKLFSLPSVSSGVVSVFKCLNKDGFIIHIVGMQGDVHDVQEAMVRNDEKAVHYVHVKSDEDGIQLIQKLDFIGHLQKMQLHVDIAPLENDRTVLEFSGDDIDLLDKAVEEWNMFSRRIIIRTVHLPVGGKRLLLHQSSEALKYIYSQLNANGIFAYVKVSTSALFVMCLSEKAVNAAENVMEKCIIGKEVSRNFFHSDVAKTFLLSHDGKIVIADNDGTLCFTNDIQQELNVILKDIEKPKLSTIQKKLDRNSVHVLQKFDFQQHLNQKNLKVKFGVTIDDPCIIELKGLIQEEVDQASELYDVGS